MRDYRVGPCDEYHTKHRRLTQIKKLQADPDTSSIEQDSLFDEGQALKKDLTWLRAEGLDPDGTFPTPIRVIVL